MKSQNLEKVEVEMEKKTIKRAIKKRGKMKVSGAGVKKLARIISNK